MNIKDAPNDHEDYKHKSDIRKKIFVTNNDGSYTSINSDGWEVENFATRQAWDAVNEELEEIKQKVLKDELSPIAYYMHKCLMELPILARHIGKWQWQVKRHLTPKGFAKLSPDMLKKYAQIFNITPEDFNIIA